MSEPITIRVTRRKLHRIQREVAAGRRSVRWYAKRCTKRCATPPLGDLVLVQLTMDAVDHRGRLISGSYATNLMRPHRYVIARGLP